MCRRVRTPLIGVFFTSLFSFGALAGCSPLPGSALDPVYLGQRTGTASESTGAPAPPQSEATQPPVSKGAPPMLAVKPTGVWAGRYHDSRGDGDMTFTLAQGESGVSGSWKLRTGGGGPLSGTLEANGRLRLRLESSAPECPGVFEGWAELSETVLTGAYHGEDCEGPVTDGWLQLRPR